MYLDKLDGRVDGAFFDKVSAEWRADQNRCLRAIERHEAAEQGYMDAGVQILELARKGATSVRMAGTPRKRRLLNFGQSRKNEIWLGD
jgi:site-specific DNA recombinase